MQNNQDIRKALDDTLDWLSGQPESVIREMFSDKRIPSRADFQWTIVGTTPLLRPRFATAPAWVGQGPLPAHTGH